MSTYEQIENDTRATLDALDAQLEQAHTERAAAVEAAAQWQAAAEQSAENAAAAAAALTDVTARLAAAVDSIEELTAERAQLLARIAALENPPVAVQPTDGLWFRLPDQIRDQPRKMFGHYFGPFPRSLDNADPASDYYARHYLTSTGESGKHAAYGAFLRNRPLGRSAIAGDYLLEDCKFDIRAAAAGGYDGFLVDIMGSTGATMDRYLKLRDAAVALNLPNFFVVPMLDTNGDMAKSYAAGTMTADAVAARLAQFAGRSCSWYLDGKFVLSSFKAEGLNATQWQGVLDALSRAGVPSVFLSVELDFGKAASLAPVTIGEGSWGFGADPALIRSAGNQVTQSHSRGKAHVYPLMSQSLRPNGGWWDEALNTEGGRASWDKAIAEGADYVQKVTWSDYSEGAEAAPSVACGRAVLDLDAWYATQWKTGTTPAILRDAAILSHRACPVGAVPTGPQTRSMRQWVGSGRPTSGQSKPRDAVEALVFLTAPATVRITTAGGVVEHSAPAGQSAWLAPLAVGAPPTVEVVRAGQVVAQVASTVTVEARPRIDNPQYFWFASLRGTEGQFNPVA